MRCACTVIKLVLRATKAEELVLMGVVIVRKRLTS